MWSEALNPHSTPVTEAYAPAYPLMGVKSFFQPNLQISKQDWH